MMYKQCSRFAVLASAIFIFTGCAVESPAPESVRNSAINVAASARIFEEKNEVAFKIDLLTADANGSDEDVRVSFPVGTTRSELQVQQPDGTYKAADNVDYESYSRFTLKEYVAPSSYRIILYRPNGEEVETATINIISKFKSTISNENVSIVNNDSTHLDFNTNGGASSTEFDGYMTMTVVAQCQSRRQVTADNTGRFAFPYTFDLQEILPEALTDDEFPCVSTYRGDITFLPPFRSRIISAEVGNSMKNAGAQFNVFVLATERSFLVEP